MKTVPVLMKLLFCSPKLALEIIELLFRCLKLRLQIFYTLLETVYYRYRFDRYQLTHKASGK